MNNVDAPDYVSIELILFDGLFTEASPEALPSGASPLCLNCDFEVGTVFQRPGLFSAYVFNTFLTASPHFAQSVADPGSSGEVPWLNPTNVTLNTIGTYATVVLNFSGGGSGAFDQSASASHDQVFPGPPDTITLGPVTPAFPNEWGIIFLNGLGPSSIPSGGGTWSSDIGVGSGNGYISGLLQSGQFSTTQSLTSGASPWASLLSMFFTDGLGTPSIVQSNHLSASNVTQVTVTFTGNTTPGNTLLVAITGTMPHPPGGLTPAVPVVSDSQNNTFGPTGSVFLPSTSSPVNYFGVQISLFAATLTGTTHDAVLMTGLANLFNSAVVYIAEVTHLKAPVSGTVSQELQGLNYLLNIAPTQQILGIQVLLFGHQSSSDASSIVTVKLFNSTSTSVQSFTGQLPAVDGVATFGTPGSTWGYQLTAALLNDPSFGAEVEAQTAATNVTFDLYGLILKIYLTPFPAPSINYLKTFDLTSGEIYNLALASSGTLYQEDLINAPGLLTAVYTVIEPNSFAESCTLDDREFIAVSDLKEGTDIPIKYNPPNFTRISQVGPGAAPTASTTTAGSTIVSITQNPAISILTTGFLLVSAGPGDTGSFGKPATPGNILTFVFPNTETLPSYFVAGINVVIKGIPPLNGFDVNNGDGTNPPFYTVSSVGLPISGQQFYDAFTVTIPYNFFSNPHTPAGITVQATLATLTAAAQVPNIEVGSSLQIAGTGGAPTAGYDGTYNVQATPNASQVQITATQILNNVAIYSYVLVTGSNPTAGQFITVTGTFNGNGIFNVQNAVIASATSGTFSINLTNPNISSSAENGGGIIFGTIFQFDPEVIVGNRSGGTIVSAGVIAEGQRKICYAFLTSDGYITQPSPILTIQVPSGASALVVGTLLSGPSNTVARIIMLTAANGGQFYYIDLPVTVTSNGVSVINSSTVVRDNSTTSVSLSFDDAVLTADIEVDVQGNNRFECAELGSLTFLIPYSQRLVAVNEQNKITNLLNWSFDGGIQVNQGNTGSGAVNQTYPAGWTIDPVNGLGGSVVNSPLFGFAYQITNASGSTQAAWGMIFQSAYQDEFGVAIIEASTLYSVRITCQLNGVFSTGALIVDLFSPKFGFPQGDFAIQFAQMSTNMVIYTGTLLTTAFSPVPNDLRLRIWVEAMPNGSTVTIDRVEVFPTEQPNLSNQVTLSYQGDFESFDQVSGVIETNVLNQQPCVTAFVLFDSLYLVKTGSFIATKDNQQTEPEFWAVPRTISNSVGTPSIYGVTSGKDSQGVETGEEWALIAGQAGLYIFNGGEPIKLSEEIQSLWNYIYWLNGYLLWVVNDIINRRILVGVPMRSQVTIAGITTQNPWIPTTALATTKTPSFVNCILELNYKQLNTSGMLAESVGVRTSYSARLIAREISRKWSVWTVQAPCAAFLRQPDGSAPLFVGNSAATGKIYQFVDQLFQDDGAAIFQAYQTYGFVQGDTGQQTQMGLVRYNYDYMTMVLTLSGTLTITVYPNSLQTPYSHTLLPNLTGPLVVNGDIELPLNECGSRLYFMFSCNTVGSGFVLSRMVVAMHQDPWAPVRGGNY